MFKTASNNSLIINLVSRQFISFWLINLPNKADTKHFQKITIILSGRAKLKYLSEKNDDGFISILHAPTYDDSKKPGQNYQQKWFTYLKDNFCLSASNVMYTEHLYVFCHIYNVKIDLSILFDVYLNPSKTSDTGPNQSVVQFLEKEEAINEFQLDNCLIDYADSYLGQCQSGSLHSSGRTDIYLVEIDQEHDFHEHLRFFVNDCDPDKEYHIILFLNMITFSKETTKRIIFEYSSCKLKLLVIKKIHLIIYSGGKANRSEIKLSNII